jgi:DNA-binding transcriptional MocR family regulator
MRAGLGDAARWSIRLLDWAAQESVWVIEDDYLSELQLSCAGARLT